MPTAKPRLVCSFDSCGWLYCYQLGAARYLEQQLLPGLGADGSAFSGSSAGSLVGAVLAAGVDIEEIASGVIASQPECRWRPWQMLDKVAWAVKQHIPDGAHKLVSGRLRILLTRVQFAWPPVQPLVVESFASTPQLRESLRASCHIPGLGGLRPLEVDLLEPGQPAGGGGRAACFDGSAWPSWLCRWRVWSADDRLLTVSGLSAFFGDLGPPLLVPLHWVIVPPAPEVLWRLYSAGYEDAARHFETVDRARRRGRLWQMVNHQLLLPILVGWVQLVGLLVGLACVLLIARDDLLERPYDALMMIGVIVLSLVGLGLQLSP